MKFLALWISRLRCCGFSRSAAAKSLDSVSNRREGLDAIVERKLKTVDQKLYSDVSSKRTSVPEVVEDKGYTIHSIYYTVSVLSRGDGITL